MVNPTKFKTATNYSIPSDNRGFKPRSKFKIRKKIEKNSFVPNYLSFSQKLTRFCQNFPNFDKVLPKLQNLLLDTRLTQSDAHSALHYIKNTCGIELFYSISSLFLNAKEDLIASCSLANPFVSPKFFVSTAKPSYFSIALKNIQSTLGINVLSVMPEIGSNDVKASDEKNLSLYTFESLQTDTVFGTSATTGKSIHVNMGIALIAACNATCTMFSGATISPVSTGVIVDHILSKDASSGIPFRGLKSSINKDAFKCDFGRFVRNFKPSFLIPLGTYFAHRFQVSQNELEDKYTLKARLVFVISLYMMIASAMCFYPLLDAFHQSSLISGYASNYFTPRNLSTRVHNLRVSESLISESYNRSNKRRYKNLGKLINIDFSKYDTSHKPYLKILFYMTMFPFALIQAPFLGGVENFTLIYWSIAILSTYQPIYYKGNFPLLTNGSCLTGEYTTAFFNSWVHLFLLHYYKIVTNSRVKIDGINPDIVIQGDDGLYTSAVDIDKFMEICSTLGLNISKPGIYNFNSSKVYFLGRRFDVFSRPYQNRNWFLTHAAFNGGFTPDIPPQILYTMRNFSFIIDYYNKPFLVSLFSKIDSVFASYYERYLRGEDVIVWVYSRTAPHFQINFHDLFEMGFKKYKIADGYSPLEPFSMGKS